MAAKSHTARLEALQSIRNELHKDLRVQSTSEETERLCGRCKTRLENHPK